MSRAKPNQPPQSAHERVVWLAPRRPCEPRFQLGISEFSESVFPARKTICDAVLEKDLFQYTGISDDPRDARRFIEKNPPGRQQDQRRKDTNHCPHCRGGKTGSESQYGPGRGYSGGKKSNLANAQMVELRA